MTAGSTYNPIALEAARRVHRALGDETRLLIARRVAKGPCTVSAIIADTRIAGPLVSWHLRKLSVAGLINQTKSGRETVCNFNYQVLATAHALMLQQLNIVDPEAWIAPSAIAIEAAKSLPLRQED